MKVIQAGQVSMPSDRGQCGRCGCCRLLLPLLTLNCHSWLGALVQAATQLNVSRGKEKPYADRLRDHIARVDGRSAASDWQATHSPSGPLAGRTDTLVRVG